MSFKNPSAWPPSLREAIRTLGPGAEFLPKQWPNELDLEKLLEFLNSIEGWADPNANEETPKPGLKTMTIKKGDWTYVDQYVGGEPFQGIEIAWFDDVPVWSMSYRGHWAPSDDYKAMLTFVKNALERPPYDFPSRGPKEWKTKEMPGWRYENFWDGNIKEFVGMEKIKFRRKEVGWTSYQGGLVNLEHLNQ
jgi:hypothetical protein